MNQKNEINHFQVNRDCHGDDINPLLFVLVPSIGSLLWTIEQDNGLFFVLLNAVSVQMNNRSSRVADQSKK